MLTFRSLPVFQPRSTPSVPSTEKNLPLEFGPPVVIGNTQDGVVSLIGWPKGDVSARFEMGYFHGNQALYPKNIINISSQSGCVGQCPVCNIGDMPLRAQLTPEMMVLEVRALLREARKVGVNVDLKDHKISISQTGEPLMNPLIVEAFKLLAHQFPQYSFKFSTVLPAYEASKNRFLQIAEFASKLDRPIQVQIHVASTDDSFRRRYFGNKMLIRPVEEIGILARQWRDIYPGRKPNVNLVIASGTPADPFELKKHLPPEIVNVRLRPYVPSERGLKAGLAPLNGGELEALFQRFAEAGYPRITSGIPSPLEREYGVGTNWIIGADQLGTEHLAARARRLGLNLDSFGTSVDLHRQRPQTN